MHLDVRDLKRFYYRTRLGRAAQRAVREQLISLWPAAKGETVGGFGFAVPLLRPFLAEAERVIALMPGQQGVMPWPDRMPNVAVLCAETLWPLPPDRLDRLVVLHGLETSEHPAALLSECWRALKGAGRIVFVVPNRAGLWARNDATPFGFGRPYTLTQLADQLRVAGFEVERHAAALYQPPSEARFWLRTGPFLEATGRRISGRFVGGVLIVEAVKTELRPTRPGRPETVRRPLRVLEGGPQPVPSSG